MVLTRDSVQVCPPGQQTYVGELFAGAGLGQVGIGGFGSGAAQIGIGSFAQGGPLPPNCHYVADYAFGSSSGGSASGGQL